MFYFLQRDKHLPTALKIISNNTKAAWRQSAGGLRELRNGARAA